MNLRRRRFSFLVLGGGVALCSGLIGGRAAGLPILATASPVHSAAPAHQLSSDGPATGREIESDGTEAPESPEVTETPEATETPDSSQTPEPSDTPEPSETPDTSEDAQGDQQEPASADSDASDSTEHSDGGEAPEGSGTGTR